jgi:hypothetical protein
MNGAKLLPPFKKKKKNIEDAISSVRRIVDVWIVRTLKEAKSCMK